MRIHPCAGERRMHWEVLAKRMTGCWISSKVSAKITRSIIHYQRGGEKKRGIKRFVRQILSLSGKVVLKDKRVVGIIINPLYPLIDRIKTAFEALLRPFDIYVSLYEI